MRHILEMGTDAAVLSLLACALWRLRGHGDEHTPKFWAWFWTVAAVTQWIVFGAFAAALMIA